MSGIKPLGDRILIRFDPTEDGERERESGVIMPARAVDDVHQWGTVLATGPGRISKKGTLTPPDVKVGDRVLYVRYLKETHTGQSLRHQDCLAEDQFLIQESDIIAIEEA